MTEDEHKDFKTRLRDSGAPKRHRLWEGPSTEPLWDAALAKVLALYGTGSLVALHGKRGPGKTQLAVEVMKHALMQEHSARYVRAMDIFVTLKATYGNHDRSSVNEQTVLNEICKPALLVIDELQESADTPWEARMLCYVVDWRYGEMRDTLLIGNFKTGELEQRLGDSIVSRLTECGGLIHFGWDSFR